MAHGRDRAVTASATGERATAEATRSGRAALLVSAGILVSRLAGLVRQRVVAHYFGTSAEADAITAGFRVGNITQNLLGEGTLGATFIPVYARLRVASPADAARFALAALGALGLAAVAISGLGAVFARPIASVLAAGLDGPRLELTIKIVRVAFPMTGVLVMSAWALGVLNAHRRFFFPYAAPVIWSLAQIGGLVAAAALLGLRGGSLAVALAFAALGGAVLQLALLAAPARVLVGGLMPTLELSAPGVREALSRFPSALFARGIVQVSGLIDTLLVSFLGAGEIAAFAYAQTLYLLPMSLLGTGEAAAQLPEIAAAQAKGELDERRAAVRARVGGALQRVVMLSLPATVVLAVFGNEVTSVVLRSGSFDASSVRRVEPLLAAYAFALLGNAAGRVLSATSYAIGDAKSPARLALLRVAVSTAIGVALLRPLGALGVVCGAVVAGWVEAVALSLRVRAYASGLGLERLRLGRAALAALAAAAAGLAARYVVGSSPSATLWSSALVLVAAGAGFAVAAPALGLIRLPERLRR